MVVNNPHYPKLKAGWYSKDGRPCYAIVVPNQPIKKGIITVVPYGDHASLLPSYLNDIDGKRERWINWGLGRLETKNIEYKNLYSTREKALLNGV